MTDRISPLEPSDIAAQMTSVVMATMWADDEPEEPINWLHEIVTYLPVVVAVIAVFLLAMYTIAEVLR